MEPYGKLWYSDWRFVGVNGHLYVGQGSCTMRLLLEFDFTFALSNIYKREGTRRYEGEFAIMGSLMMPLSATVWRAEHSTQKDPRITMCGWLKDNTELSIWMPENIE